MDYLATLWTHLTEFLCQEVFEMTRAIELYGQRWSMERCFLTLKDTLDLKLLFNASAFSGQVHATALVHDAPGLAQAEIANLVDVEPERRCRISTWSAHRPGGPLMRACGNGYSGSQVLEPSGRSLMAKPLALK